MCGRNQTGTTKHRKGPQRTSRKTAKGHTEPQKIFVTQQTTCTMWPLSGTLLQQHWSTTTVPVNGAITYGLCLGYMDWCCLRRWRHHYLLHNDRISHVAMLLFTRVAQVRVQLTRLCDHSLNISRTCRDSKEQYEPIVWLQSMSDDKTLRWSCAVFLELICGSTTVL